MTTEIFDLVIIGAGPAGYTGAIRAAQLGLKVACIEKSPTLGGTCLNVGCIPSKALLHYSEKYFEAQKYFNDWGIETETKLNLSKMLAKKDKVVSDLCKGIEGLFAKNKITHIRGAAQILDSTKIAIDDSKGEKKIISAKNILIATGSSVAQLPNIAYDEEQILSSTGALKINSVPKKLIVIGAGYIGLELGSVWSRLGSAVTVIEYGDCILPFVDNDISNILKKSLEKQNMTFQFNTKLEKIDKQKDKIIATISKENKTSSLEADKILIAVGRVPNTSGLGLDNIGIQCDEKGRIKVNNKYQTSLNNIYAVGDVIAGPMLAHKAEEEAVAAVENIAGKSGIVHYNIIPSVIYTEPEVASVGLSEIELKAKSISYKVGKFPFLANSRARAISQTEGLVKILADSKTDEILGAHIIGSGAGNLISEISVGMSFRAAAEDLALICRPHPTLSEAIKEAALDVSKRAINF